ncbi:MAG: acylphosphatase [Sulfurospirillaceae bacterium]|nr:acylphosphatase [Sulfurospirillaceae bacterium]
MKTYQLIVSGRVQGVNYRNFVLDMALALDYYGYVQNLANGDVEILVNAQFEEELEFFISKLYDGSMFSDVKNVTHKRIDFIAFDSFERR